MRKFLTGLTAAALALAVAAQQPLQCLDPQLVNGLVFLGRSDMKVTVATGQPGFMRDVKVPAELVLIGSARRGGGLDAVAYRTSLLPDKAHAALTEALAAQGWEVELPLSAATFRVSGEAPTQETLCRDGERRFVTVKDISGTRYINVVSLAQTRPRPCNENPLAGMSGSARTAMPRLQLPAGISYAQGGFGGGGGSDTNFTSSSRIITTQSAERVIEQFAAQMQDQGWEPDASWSASSGAGSTWRRMHEGQPVAGRLEVIRVGDGMYDFDITVEQP